MKRFLISLALVLMTAPAFAQGTVVVVNEVSIDPETAKFALTQARKDAFQAGMNLTPEQAPAFWNIYAEFEKERAKIAEAQAANLKSFVGNFSTMTDQQAKAVVETSFKTQTDIINLRSKYTKQIAGKLNWMVGARFAEIDDYITTIVRADLLDNAPLFGDKAK